MKGNSLSAPAAEPARAVARSLALLLLGLCALAWGAGPALTLNQQRFKPDETITIAFRADPAWGTNSWLGIVPAGVPHNDVAENEQRRLTRIFLLGKAEGEIQFKTPLAPGRYEVRMYQIGPEKREAASTGFEVWEPPSGLTFTKTRYAPGEPLTIRFTASRAYGTNSWIGIVPAEVPHGDVAENEKHNLKRKFLLGKAEGELSFTAKLKPGRYDLRMNQVGPERREVVTAGFEVLADGTFVAGASPAGASPGTLSGVAKPQPSPPSPANATPATVPAPVAAAGLPIEFLSPPEALPDTLWELRYRVLKPMADSIVLIVPAGTPLGETRAKSSNAWGLHNQVGEFATTLRLPKEMGRYELRLTERKAPDTVTAVVPLLVVDRSVPGYEWTVMDDAAFDPQKFMQALIDDTATVPAIDLDALYQSVVPPLDFPLSGKQAALPVRLAFSYGREVRSDLPLLLAAGGKSADQAFDDYLTRHQRVEATFGHDVDLKGKLEDLAKSMVGHLGMGTKAEAIIKTAVNGYDLQKAFTPESFRDGNFPFDDFAIFVVKTALDNADADELAEVGKRLGLDPEQTGLANAVSTGTAEHGATAAGNVNAGLYRDALKAVAYGGLDVACPPCGVTRRGVEVAYESVKATRAFVEDASTEMMYRQYADLGVFMVGSGQTQVINNARRALAERYLAAGRSDQPSDAEVEKFVRLQFDRWKRMEGQKLGESSTLGQARAAYLTLSDLERKRFGADPDQQAARFAGLYLRIRGDLLAYRGGHRLSEAELAKVAARLVRAYLDKGDYGYRYEFATALRSLGWIKPFMGLEDAVHARVRERLARLDHHKLQALAAYLEIEVPASFYNCLCRQVTGFSIGVGITYKPEPDDCAGSGPVCLWRGLGCGRVPLPSASKAWAGCTGSATVKTGSGDVPFDRYVAERVQRARMPD